MHTLKRSAHIIKERYKELQSWHDNRFEVVAEGNLYVFPLSVDFLQRHIGVVLFCRVVGSIRIHRTFDDLLIAQIVCFLSEKLDGKRCG